jgi:hypothetical protein
MLKATGQSERLQGDSPLSSTCYFTVMLILQSNLSENKSIAFALKQIYSINHTQRSSHMLQNWCEPK